MRWDGRVGKEWGRGGIGKGRGSSMGWERVGMEWGGGGIWE